MAYLTYTEQILELINQFPEITNTELTTKLGCDKSWPGKVRKQFGLVPGRRPNKPSAKKDNWYNFDCYIPTSIQDLLDDADSERFKYLGELTQSIHKYDTIIIGYVNIIKTLLKKLELEKERGDQFQRDLGNFTNKANQSFGKTKY